MRKPKELLAIADDEKEIEKQIFCGFGVWNRRTQGNNRSRNKQNQQIYNTRKATQGLAISILKYGKEFAEKV